MTYERHSCVIYLCLAVLSSGLILFSALIATPARDADRKFSLSRLSRFDGEHYKEIAECGYSYDPTRASTVAFFPAYPLLAASISRTFHASTIVSLLAVSNIGFVAAAWLFLLYLKERNMQHFGQGQAKRLLAMLLFMTWPTGVFLRFAYTESLFCVVLILACWCMQSRRHPLLIAAVIGIATGTRSVGVALIPAFLCYLASQDRRNWLTPARLCILLLMSLSGLLLFASYLTLEFGDPLCFAKTQACWKIRVPLPWMTKIIAIIGLEPIWSVYIPDSPCYWQSFGPPQFAPANLQFANPLYFVFAVVMTYIGWRKKLLTDYEVVLCVGLLLIPYVTRSHEMCMASHGRFAVVAFPTHIVAAHFLSRLPCYISGVCLCLCAILASTYAWWFGVGGMVI
jgi:hypothetical protein